jgi:hypothetical protein
MIVQIQRKINNLNLYFELVGGLRMLKDGKHPEKQMLPFMTICVMLVILCMAGITRATVNTDTVSNSLMTSYSAQFTEVELGDAERVILGMLFDEMELSLEDREKEDNTYYIYWESLYKHLSSSGMELGNSKADQVKVKIDELNHIIKLEQESDFTEMSINGREIAIDISKQIYKLCGLVLKTNMEGTIAYISDENGQDIYRKNIQVQQTGFHTYAFLITLSSIIILLGTIFIIVKSNQLFKKEVKSDGFDEERFA